MKPDNFIPISKSTKDRIKKHLQYSSELFCIYGLIHEMNLAGYLIGGTIRDLILNRPVKDIDIAININPEYFLKKLSRKTKGYSICLDREFFIFRFIPKKHGHSFDISPLKGDSLFQDLLQRDFTINAIAIDIRELFAPSDILTIIDPLGGVRDLYKKIIKAISNEIFQDDPLRILRAYRLAGQLNYQIEPATKNLISRDRELLKKAAPERIREELFLLLSLDYCSSHFEQLYQSGLFPFLFTQKLPPTHFSAFFERAWLHSLQTLISMEKILTDLQHSSMPSFKKLNCLLSRISGHQNTYRPLLKLAALLSGIPCPIRKEKRNISNTRKVTRTSSSTIDLLLRSLCLTTSQQKYILNCLQGYGEPINLIQKRNCTPKYFYRFFRDFGEAGLGALILSIADQKAFNGSLTVITALNDLFSQMADFYFDWQKREKHSILDGTFLMNYFHLSPGPIIGDLLDFLKEAQAEGRGTNKKEAINLAEQFLKRSKK